MSIRESIPPLLRRLPVGLKGKARLARLLLGSALDIPDRTIILPDATYLTPSRRDPIAFHLLIDGTYEPETVTLLQRLAPAGGTALDIGANIGVMALVMTRALGPGGRLVAVEASPRIARYLRHNLQANNATAVTVVEAALTDQDGGTVSFYEAPDDHFGMGSLASQFQEVAITVPARTLDSLCREQGLEQAGLIKIDVEGYEAAVFRGGEQLLRSEAAPAIVFEFCDWAEERAGEFVEGDAQRFLLSCGYRIWRGEELLAGRGPLDRVVTTGCHTLVALKGDPARVMGPA